LSQRDCTAASACYSTAVLTKIKSFDQNTGLSRSQYSARNVIGVEALIFLHDVQIPVDRQQ